jgi:hypothetical protein
VIDVPKKTMHVFLAVHDPVFMAMISNLYNFVRLFDYFFYAEECAEELKEFSVSDFSIAHRGACLQFPEHTLESYKAGAIQGAGIIECDVTRNAICTRRRML